MSTAQSLEWLACYLLGSLNGALLLGRLVGVDIRTLGSGNAGATNAWRTLGRKFALGAAAIDVAKGVLAVAVVAGTLAPAGEAQRLACGMMAAIGHCWPLWHGFRGGKGAATLFAAIATLMPWLAGALVLLWALVLGLTGYVSVATLAVGLGFALAMPWLASEAASPWLAAAAAAGLLYTHRENLARLRMGREHRFRPFLRSSHG